MATLDAAVGAGEQTLKSFTPNEKVVVDLKFTAPWESEAEATTSLEKVEGGTRESWGFSSPMAFPMNIMGLFLSGTLAKDYDKGLANLKALVEEEKGSMPAANTNYEVKTIDFPSTKVISYRKEMPLAEIGAFIQQEMPKLGAAFATNGVSSRLLWQL